MTPPLSRLLVDPMDRATRRPRRRYAEQLFWTGRGRRRDRAAAGAFFIVSLPIWRARARDAAHCAPVAAGLDHCRPPRRVVDLGTGAGAAAALIAERFPQAEVIGVDRSRTMVRVARRSFAARNLRFVRADFRRLPVPAGHFDLVASLNALPEPTELHRITGSGGQVLIADTFSVPPAGPWLRRLGDMGLRTRESGRTGDGGWLLLERV